MESRPTDKRKGNVKYNEDDYINGEASEDVLKKDWDNPKEDKVWEYLKEDAVETLDATPYNNTVKLQLRITAKVILQGSVSGKTYVWQTSGAVVEVDELDAPGLLEKKLGDKACCGGNPENLKLFVIVK